MQWNPNAPEVLGPEFIPKGEDLLPGYRVAAPTNTVMQRVPVTVTETVDAMYGFLATDTAMGKLVAEVYVAGGEVQDVTTTVLPVNYVEIEDTGVPLVPSSAPACLAILSQPSPPDPTKFVSASGPIPGRTDGLEGTVFICGFGTTGLFTGRRIVAVRCVVVASDPASKSVSVGVTEHDDRHGTDTVCRWQGPFGGANAISGPAIQAYTVDTGEIRPTAQPVGGGYNISSQFWSPADLVLFANTDNAYLEVAIAGLGGASSPPVFHDVFQIYLEVDHCPETRLANDLIVPGTTNLQWKTWTPHQPSPTILSTAARTANFTKTAGQDLTFVLRQPRVGNSQPGRISDSPADFRFTASYIEGFTDNPVSGLVPYGDARLSANGVPSILGVPTQSKIIGVGFRASGGSVDSQPYIAVIPILLDGTTVAATAVQGISGASATKHYGGVRVPLKYAGTPTPMTVDLIRISDSVVLATTTITQAIADEFPPDPTAGWRLVTVLFPAGVTLAGATQYGIRVTTHDAAWTVPALSADEPTFGTGVTGTGSYNGASDHAILTGGAYNDRDLPFVLFVLVDPPTFFTVTPSIIPL